MLGEENKYETFCSQQQLTFCFSFSFPVISELMNPGHTVFTVTPRAANSLAFDLARPITPALAAE